MTIILIDDEVVALRALEERVDWKRYGVTKVFTAGSALEAREVFAQERPGIMLCDVEMPEGDGLNLLEWVRSFYPEVICIFITCHSEYTYMKKAMVLGSFDYVLKPIDYSELDSVLQRAAVQYKQQKATRLSARSRSGGTDGLPPAECAIQFIRAHLSESICVDDIAQEAHLNPQYLMRLFKKETGYSVLEFITNERIAKAKELLEHTALPVTQVACSVGYDNYSYFSKVFKVYTNMTPSQYRKAVALSQEGKDT